MRLRVFIAWSLAMISIGCLTFVRAEDAAPSPSLPTVLGTIKIARIRGEVFAVDHATGLKTRLSLNSLVANGQTVETGPDASVVLVFSNGAVVNVKANSKISVNAFLQNPFAASFRMGDAIHEPTVSTTRLELLKGEIVAQVKKLNRDAGSSFTVETPVGAAGVRGTAFDLGYFPEGGAARFILSMAEGLIQFVPIQGRAIDVPAGREVTASASIDPQTGKVISISEVPTLLEISPASQAVLQQSVADTLGTTMKVEFAPSTNAPSSTGTGSTPGTNSGTTTPPASNGDQTASPSSNNETNDNPLASPPAVPPTDQTSPLQGVKGD